MFLNYIILVLVLICQSELVLGENILLVTVPEGSQLLIFTDIGEELTSRGHNVYIITDQDLSPSDKATILNAGLHIIQYNTSIYGLNDGMFNQVRQNLAKFALNSTSSVWSKLKSFPMMIEMGKDVGKRLVQDKVVIKRLTALKFDIAVVNSNQLMQWSAFTVVHKLSIPYVTLSVKPTWWYYRIPAMPSYIPHLSMKFTEVMDFQSRLTNTIISIVEQGVFYYLDDGEKYFSELTPEKPPITFRELHQNSAIHFQDTLDEVMDYVIPLMPQTVAVGGIRTRPAKPLTKDLQDFMDNAPNGVIVVSFGSLFSDFMTKNIHDKFIAAFKRLDQKIIWKFDTAIHGVPNDLSKNIKLMKWLPQNDLLAHKNTRLFITHCGNNGQYEALYHGVPMVGMPLLGDQGYNAARIVYKGFGIIMPLDELTPDKFLDTIKIVLNNPSYKNKIQKASAIFHSRPSTPVQRVGYWIEHILKFGGDHLKSRHVLAMPWYQYFMIDIAVFMLTMACIMGFIIMCVCRQCYRKCFKSQMKEKTL